MKLPGIGSVLGVIAAVYFRLSDPRRKRDILLDKKEAILKKAMSDKEALQLAAIDKELLKLQRELERRAG